MASAVEIVDIRRRLTLTQEQFARLFGVHPMTVSRWERDVAQPSFYQNALLNVWYLAQVRDSAVGAAVSTALTTGTLQDALRILWQTAFRQVL